jgi:hypothetical protein
MNDKGEIFMSNIDNLERASGDIPQSPLEASINFFEAQLAEAGAPERSLASFILAVSEETTADMSYFGRDPNGELDMHDYLTNDRPNLFSFNNKDRSPILNLAERHNLHGIERSIPGFAINTMLDDFQNVIVRGVKAGGEEVVQIWPPLVTPSELAQE